MKNVFKKFIFMMIIVCFAASNSYASTNTVKRTEDNLQVRESMIKSSNKSLILKTPKIDENEKVYDFADLLSEDEEDTIYQNIMDFIDKYDMDMAIVTTNENNKSSAEKYADDFYDYNYFGKGSTRDGLMFLVDMENREMWISTSGKAIRVFDDNRISSILDRTYLEISNQDYYNCANAFVILAGDYAEKGVPKSNESTYIDDDGEYRIVTENLSVMEKISESFLGIFMISGVVTIIFVIIVVLKHRTVKKALTANEYLNKIDITERKDVFLTTHTTSVYIPPASSSSGGGSSTHHSSSGSCHGGGGRSF